MGLCVCWREGGRTCVCIERASLCTFKTSACCTGTKPTCMEVFERVHGFFFHVFFTVPQHTKHTPRPPTTPRPQRHHDHNETHHITQHGDRNRERQRKRDKTRKEKTRQDKKAREEREEMKKKREEEERRGRENEQRQTIFYECPPAPELFFTPKTRECPGSARNYLAQMSEMSAGAGII